MSTYLRHVAERSAGLQVRARHAVPLLPARRSRFAQSFDVATIVAQPLRITPLDEPPVETPGLEDRPVVSADTPAPGDWPAANESQSRPEITPTPPAIHTPDAPAPEMTAEDSDGPATDTTVGATLRGRPTAADATVGATLLGHPEDAPLLTPLPPSPAPLQGEVLRRDDAPPGEPAPQHEKERPRYGQGTPTVRAGNAHDVGREEGKSDRPGPRPASGAAPRVTVRLEPSRPPPGPIRNDAGSAEAAPDAGAPVEVRLPPPLTREPPRHEVRVSIGRVEVRVESDHAPVPVTRQPAEPDDPFASLSLARRGWRSPF